MDPRQRARVLVVTFVGLLALHGWVLTRMIARQDNLIIVLLLVAIALFTWRLGHYAAIAVAPPAVESSRPGNELQRIRFLVPVLAGVFALHVWLMTQMIAAGENLFTAALAVGAGVIAVRVGAYALRYRHLRRAATAA